MSTLHNFTFYTIKNGARFATAFCFVFTKVKRTVDAHRITCETYDEKIITIRTCAN